MSLRLDRPYVTLKLATSLDGRIALANGHSQWITGPQSRNEVHYLRSKHDAVLTGIGTVIADDPQMTARPEGQRADIQPRRIVLDTRARMSSGAQMLGSECVWIFHSQPDPAPLPNVEHIRIDKDRDGHVDVHQVLSVLANRSVNTVMVEAGAQVAGAFVRAGLVDRIEWFRAPILIGAEGRPCISGLALEQLDLSPMFQRVSVRECGADLWETYKRG